MSRSFSAFVTFSSLHRKTADQEGPSWLPVNLLCTLVGCLQAARCDARRVAGPVVNTPSLGLDMYKIQRKLIHYTPYDVVMIVQLLQEHDLPESSLQARRRIFHGSCSTRQSCAAIACVIHIICYHRNNGGRARQPACISFRTA